MMTKQHSLFVWGLTASLCSACAADVSSEQGQGSDPIVGECVDDTESVRWKLNARNQFNGGDEKGALMLNSRFGEMAVAVELEAHRDADYAWYATVAVLLPMGEEVDPEEYTIEIRPMGCEDYPTTVLEYNKDSVEQENHAAIYQKEYDAWADEAELNEEERAKHFDEDGYPLALNIGGWAEAIPALDERHDTRDGMQLIEVTVRRDPAGWRKLNAHSIRAILVAPSHIQPNGIKLEAKHAADEYKGSFDASIDLDFPENEITMSWLPHSQANVIAKIDRISEPYSSRGIGPADWQTSQPEFYDYEDSGFVKIEVTAEKDPQAIDSGLAPNLTRTAWLAQRKVSGDDAGFVDPNVPTAQEDEEDSVPQRYRFVSSVKREYSEYGGKHRIPTMKIVRQKGN